MSANMKHRPADPRLFYLNGEVPVLLGSRCPACVESFFPYRRLCPICMRELSAVDLPGTGTLYSHTCVHVRSFKQGRIVDGGYGIGEVDLSHGPRIQTALSGDPDSWRIGLQMRIDLEIVEEGDGEGVVMYCFRPVGA